MAQEINLNLKTYSQEIQAKYPSQSNVALWRHLRSASRRQLLVPRHNLSTYGRRAFSVAGPAAWNLPVLPGLNPGPWRQPARHFEYRSLTVGLPRPTFLNFVFRGTAERSFWVS